MKNILLADVVRDRDRAARRWQIVDAWKSLQSTGCCVFPSGYAGLSETLALGAIEKETSLSFPVFDGNAQRRKTKLRGRVAGQPVWEGRRGTGSRSWPHSSGSGALAWVWPLKRVTNKANEKNQARERVLLTCKDGVPQVACAALARERRE